MKHSFWLIIQFGLSQIQRPSQTCIIEKEEVSQEESTPSKPDYPVSQAALEGYHKNIFMVLRFLFIRLSCFGLMSLTLKFQFLVEIRDW